jgi:cbb3-type cytochrome oxidase subunit 1
MKSIAKILTIITFVLSSATIGSVFYEGMILQWLSFVGILILLTDVSFLLSTIFGTIYYKKQKSLFYSHLFSIAVIFTGIILTLIFGKSIPKILFTFWEFYIFYFYSIAVMKQWWKKS